LKEAEKERKSVSFRFVFSKRLEVFFLHYLCDMDFYLERGEGKERSEKEEKSFTNNKMKSNI
jgi:hypothetical protein